MLRREKQHPPFVAAVDESCDPCLPTAAASKLAASSGQCFPEQEKEKLLLNHSLTKCVVDIRAVWLPFKLCTGTWMNAYTAFKGNRPLLKFSVVTSIPIIIGIVADEGRS